MSIFNNRIIPIESQRKNDELHRKAFLIYMLREEMKTGLPLLDIFPMEKADDGTITKYGMLMMDQDNFTTHCREIEAKGDRPGIVWDRDKNRASIYQQTAESAPISRQQDQPSKTKPRRLCSCGNELHGSYKQCRECAMKKRSDSN